MARPLPRICALAVLTALLAAPWCTAAPPPHREPAPQLLARLWLQLADLWRDIGCIADPGGGCRENSSTQAGDSGCIMDPYGGCRGESSSTPTGDIGCGIDPHGHCGGLGLGMDPNG